MPGNERLRKLRIERNWRQQDVADQVGVTLTTMQRWERGSQQPSAYYRVKLCALFGLSAQELGLLEELPTPTPVETEARNVADSGATSSDEITLWTVPYTRNPNFTGRDDLLERLTRQLAPHESGQPIAIRRAALTQAQVIKGLGGIGKTQAAVEFAYRVREQGRYTHTLWINAGSSESILTSFAALAEQLPTFASAGETDQRKLVAAVIRWLEQCSHPWLLIFDNADDPSLVQPYLPLKGNGSILLTTRASAVGWLASSLEVDVMGVLEGAELFLRRAQRFAHATDSEINEAINVVIALAQFPLALDQAGAYIEETGCSVGDYLQIYQTHRRDLLSRRGRQATKYPSSVATTWSLSFEYVERTNPAAAELLRLCAFLAPDGIPEELLTQGAPYWPPALQEAAADHFRFNQALETLLAFSLVKRLSENRLLSIHRLVQVVQAERLSGEERGQWVERVVRVVHAVFPRDPQEVASWPLCQRYLEQVQVCDTLIREQQVLLPEAADVLDRAGVYLFERALYALAEPLYQRALSIWAQQDQPQPVSRVQALQHLANLYASQGKYTEAEPFYQEAIEVLEQQLGSEHVLLAGPLRGLAHLYTNRAKYAQAEPIYQRALRLLEQQWGPEHPQVTYVLTALSFVYSQQGQYAQAEFLGQRVLRIREQHLGPEHLRVATALITLAIVNEKRREYAQAETYFLRALHIREQHLGTEHPDVAVVLNELAHLYTEQRKFTQAEPLYQQALLIREQQLGPESRYVGDSLYLLADLYTQKGEYMRAELLFGRALHICEQQFGQDSAQVSDVLLGLARLYFQQGAMAQAEPLYQRALFIREEQYGPEHLETADALYDFASFRHAQGRVQEAAVLYKRALAIRETVLGRDHPKSSDTRKSLHTVLVVLEGKEETAQTEE